MIIQNQPGGMQSVGLLLWIAFQVLDVKAGITSFTPPTGVVLPEVHPTGMYFEGSGLGSNIRVKFIGPSSSDCTAAGATMYTQEFSDMLSGNTALFVIAGPIHFASPGEYYICESSDSGSTYTLLSPTSTYKISVVGGTSFSPTSASSLSFTLTITGVGLQNYG